METLRWIGDELSGRLVLIDQTLLPTELVEIELDTLEGVWEAIKVLRVRGAPAIGIAAAYGVVIGMQSVATDNVESWFTRLDEVADYLASSRPTAVNLFWAIDRERQLAASLREFCPPPKILTSLLDEARTIHDEDRQMCRAIGHFGAGFLADGDGVLTHCNAGGLATADYGTALAVIFTAQENGKTLHVYADETRPLLQGARLTAWELKQRNIDVTVICDSTAAQVMREGRVQAVVTGADRIVANGDVANKIGTYQLALVAAAHEIPFYVAAPSSTFDRSLASGNEIPIEERDAKEVTHVYGRQTAPDGVKIYNPAFDVTPARLIRALICERGIVEPVTREEIDKILGAVTAP